MKFRKDCVKALYRGHLVLASVIAWLGCAWFLKTRKGFADVL